MRNLYGYGSNNVYGVGLGDWTKSWVTLDDTNGLRIGNAGHDSTGAARIWVRDSLDKPPSLAELKPGETVQFERLGYFCPDTDSRPGHPVFNRTLTLKDTWAKLQAQGRQG